MTTAQTLLDNFLAETGHAEYNQILVDIKGSVVTAKEAEKGYHMAVNSCVSDTIKTWMDEKTAEFKTEKLYDAMTDDEKTAFDTMITEMQDKKITHIAEVKYEAGYHEMTTSEKEIFDKLMIAQMTLDMEAMKSVEDKINRNGMTKEEFEAMTDEEKEAHMAKMKEMREKMGEMAGDKMQDRMKSDTKMMMEAGYMSKSKDGRQ
jgi:hypothetical protein